MTVDKIHKRVTTVEELKQIHDAYCSKGRCGDTCLKVATQELRNEYAAKYGCICGCDCKKCCDYVKCFCERLD